MKNVVMLSTTKEWPLRILASRPDITVTVITEPQYADLHTPFVAPIYVDDIEDFTMVRTAMLSSGHISDITHVITPSERTLQTGAYLRALLDLPGIPPKTANVMSNKYAMKRAFKASGLPVTPFRLLLDIANLPKVAAGMKWPLAVKPVLGTGSIDIAILESLDHYEEFYQSAASAAHRARTKPLILEEAIDYLWEFHCDGIVRDGSVVFAQPGRFFESLLGSIGNPNGSWVIPPNSADWTAICELHRSAVETTGLRDGITHMEGYRTTRGYLIGEISCRPGGGSITDLVLAQQGVDLWSTFIQLSLGEDITVEPHWSTRQLAQCWLPPRPGVVRRITAQDELTAIPWIRSAAVAAQVGDRIESAFHSTSQVATMIYEALTYEEAFTRMSQLTEIFELEVA
jgi:biotin carboxylase